MLAAPSHRPLAGKQAVELSRKTVRLMQSRHLGEKWIHDDLTAALIVHEEPIESPQEVVIDERVGGERVMSKTKIDDVTWMGPCSHSARCCNILIEIIPITF